MRYPRKKEAYQFNQMAAVSNTHVQVQGTYGYSPDDFPKKVKPPTKKEIDKFIASVRYPKFAAFAVGKLMKKFNFTREQAETAWRARG